MLFFHNKLFFYNDIENKSHYIFFVGRHQAMLLRLHKRSSRAMLLKTEEADEALNITEN